MITSETCVYMNEATTNFEAVTKLVDANGPVTIIEGNSPKYLVIPYDEKNTSVTLPDEVVMKAVDELMDCYSEAFQRLAE